MEENSLDSLLFSILKITNEPSETDELILEKCSDFNSQLSGYYIVLETDKFPSLEMFLCHSFPKHNEEISQAFNSEDNLGERITQCCYTYYPGSFTGKFLEKYETVENLVKFGPMGDYSKFKKLQESRSEYIEEEDEEMIKELQEKIKNLEAAIESKDEEINKLREIVPDELISVEAVGNFLTCLEQQEDGFSHELIRDSVMSFIENDEDEKLSTLVLLLLDQLAAKGAV